MKKLLDAHAKTAEERQALSERLEREAVERRKIEKTKGMLLGKLQAMEAKLIQVRRKRRHDTGRASGEKGGGVEQCNLPKTIAYKWMRRFRSSSTEPLHSNARSVKRTVVTLDTEMENGG